jgi:hypothetical protein
MAVGRGARRVAALEPRRGATPKEWLRVNVKAWGLDVGYEVSGRAWSAPEKSLANRWPAV